MRIKILRMSWTKHISNEEVLNKIGIPRKRIHTIRKRQWKPVGNIIRKECLENLTLTQDIVNISGVRTNSD